MTVRLIAMCAGGSFALLFAFGIWEYRRRRGLALKQKLRRPRVASLKKKDEPSAKWWSFLNQPIIIWFMSSILLSFGTWKYQKDETAKLVLKQHQELLIKTLLELGNRSEHFKFSAERYPTVVHEEDDKNALQTRSILLEEGIQAVSREIEKEKTLESAVNENRKRYEALNSLSSDEDYIREIAGMAKQPDLVVTEFIDLLTFSDLKRRTLSNQDKMERITSLLVKEETTETGLSKALYQQLVFSRTWLGHASDRRSEGHLPFYLWKFENTFKIWMINDWAIKRIRMRPHGEDDKLDLIDTYYLSELEKGGGRGLSEREMCYAMLESRYVILNRDVAPLVSQLLQVSQQQLAEMELMKQESVAAIARKEFQESLLSGTKIPISYAELKHAFEEVRDQDNLFPEFKGYPIPALLEQAMQLAKADTKTESKDLEGKLEAAQNTYDDLGAELRAQDGRSFDRQSFHSRIEVRADDFKARCNAALKAGQMLVNNNKDGRLAGLF